jgi:hypothetical protein
MTYLVSEKMLVAHQHWQHFFIEFLKNCSTSLMRNIIFVVGFIACCTVLSKRLCPLCNIGVSPPVMLANGKPRIPLWLSWQKFIGKQLHVSAEWNLNVLLSDLCLGCADYTVDRNPTVLTQHFSWFYSVSQEKFRDQDVDGMIILRWIFRKWEGVVGTGWSWFRIGTGGGCLWVR